MSYWWSCLWLTLPPCQQMKQAQIPQHLLIGHALKAFGHLSSPLLFSQHPPWSGEPRKGCVLPGAASHASNAVDPYRVLWLSPQQISLLRDQLCFSHAGLAYQQPHAPEGGCALSCDSVCLQRRHCFSFMSVNHVARWFWFLLKPPGPAVVQIIAWNLFQVRYFLSVSNGLNY